jgi:hypothetical protein
MVSTHHCCQRVHWNLISFTAWLLRSEAGEQYEELVQQLAGLPVSTDIQVRRIPWSSSAFS